ncbi:MAG: metallophosphoesterase, partial [Bacteroides sp.]|nr:metallophosphoesterase [Bacteroides sp.]
EGGYYINKKQLEWLKKELSELSSSDPVVLSTHVPFYSLYYPLVENRYVFLDVITNYKEVLDVLKDYNIQLVLQGHQHIHEEILLQNIQFITGGAVCANWWNGPFYGTKEGFLLVEIDKQNKFTWEYVSYGWEAKK